MKKKTCANWTLYKNHIQKQFAYHSLKNGVIGVNQHIKFIFQACHFAGIFHEAPAAMVLHHLAHACKRTAQLSAIWKQAI